MPLSTQSLFYGHVGQVVRLLGSLTPANRKPHRLIRIGSLEEGRREFKERCCGSRDFEAGWEWNTKRLFFRFCWVQNWSAYLAERRCAKMEHWNRDRGCEDKMALLNKQKKTKSTCQRVVCSYIMHNIDFLFVQWQAVWWLMTRACRTSDACIVQVDTTRDYLQHSGWNVKPHWHKYDTTNIIRRCIFL